MSNTVDSQGHPVCEGDHVMFTYGNSLYIGNTIEVTQNEILRISPQHKVITGFSSHEKTPKSVIYRDSHRVLVCDDSFITKIMFAKLAGSL